MKQTSTIRDVLADIGIEGPTAIVYTALLREGEATARMIAHRTEIARTSVYDHLNLLRSKGLIVERAVEGATLFDISDTRRLAVLLDERAESIAEHRRKLDEDMKSLLSRARSVQPKIRFFEGEDGVKQLMKDLLWYEDLTISLYWPYEDMLRFLGREFLLWFDERRKRRNISLRTIWDVDKKATSIFDDGQDVERRFLSQEGAVPMSSIIYDNKVAFVSSHKEAFGFIVESREFSDLERRQFELMWEAASEVPPCQKPSRSQKGSRGRGAAR
jgi:sugar-specific transcriptional regulator TrmB